MDTQKLLKSTRAARRQTSIPVRSDGELVFLDELPESGEAVMLDACVYIDQLQGRLPAAVEGRITARSAYHSSVALSEVCFPFGRLDPGDPRTSTAVNEIELLISAIPERCIMAISPFAQSRGAILAGVMARGLGLSDSQRRKCLMDAMLAAHASEEQLLLVTRNVSDFDRLSQLDSRLKVAFYRI